MEPIIGSIAPGEVEFRGQIGKIIFWRIKQHPNESKYGKKKKKGWDGWVSWLERNVNLFHNPVENWNKSVENSLNQNIKESLRNSENLVRIWWEFPEKRQTGSRKDCHSKWEPFLIMFLLLEWECCVKARRDAEGSNPLLDNCLQRR
jgi:hypothetical protein